MALLTQKPSRVRSNRARTAQYEIYVQFIEEHPQFINQLLNYKYDQNELQKEWQELTELLNKPPMPVKSISQWKTALQQWRYSIVKKAREYEQEVIKHDGKLESIDKKYLTELQKRALVIFGNAAVTGIKGAPIEIGFGVSKSIKKSLNVCLKLNSSVLFSHRLSKNQALQRHLNQILNHQLNSWSSSLRHHRNRLSTT